jgi:hypothetical protein
MKKKSKTKKQQKQYFENVPRKWVYGILAVLALIAAVLFLSLPHYKPLKLASDQQIQDAHHDVIQKFFVSTTTCKNDVEDKAARIKEFNQYFKVNKYANRAVIRGCNDADMLLVKGEDSQWQPSNVNIILDFGQNPEWQKACLIDDITKTDTKVRPENNSIDANNLKLCDSLIKESYIHAWFAH